MEVIDWKENKEGWYYLFWGNDSNEKTKIFIEFLYVSLDSTIFFGRKQKYLWKHFYSIKKPLNNRAIDSKGPYHWRR